MDLHLEAPTSYRVEVSGWDASENFFVEKVCLEWSRVSRKEILIRSVLSEGCVVFVRLLQSCANTRAYNLLIAYEAVKVAPKESDGRTRVYLERLQPRETLREPAKTLDDPAIKVA